MARRPPRVHRCAARPRAAAPPKELRRPRKAVLSRAVYVRRAAWLCPAQICSALCGKGRGRFGYGKRALFAPLAMPKPRRGLCPFARAGFCYNKISTGPRAARPQRKGKGVFIWAALLRGTAWPSILRARCRCLRPSPSRGGTRGPLINWATHGQTVWQAFAEPHAPSGPIGRAVHDICRLWLGKAGAGGGHHAVSPPAARHGPQRSRSPAANLLLAYVYTVLYKLVGYLAPRQHVLVFVFVVLSTMVNVNITLAVFNLLPVPPLDGSRIFNLLLPKKWYFCRDALRAHHSSGAVCRAVSGPSGCR